MARLTARILGCGSSGGVPRLGGIWGACDPAEPRNARSRCSLLLTLEGTEGTTTALIDTSPDMRAQLLAAGTGRLDAVVYTHAHADHVHGLDDLRMVVFNMQRRMQVWADAETEAALRSRFGYAFERPEGSLYPPICDLHPIAGRFDVSGEGGALPFTPVPVQHGGQMALGFRIGALAYIPDVSEIPPASWALLQGLDVLIIDALRRKPHPTHAHLERTLGWIEALTPRRAVLTNMHVDLDYRTLMAETPAHVAPAFDGMEIETAAP